MRRDSQILRENRGLLGQQIERRVDPVDVAACGILVAKKVQRHGEKTIGQHQVGRIVRTLRCFRETLSELECLEKFAIVELVDAQAPEGAQAKMLVIELVRQRQRDRKCRACIPRTTLTVHQ